jgi:long-subunit acyl-CoA synthetase (AMP-forming)
LLDNNESIKDGLQNDQIRGIALAHIRDYGKLKDLNELELIHNLYLDIEEFTTGNNLLTPTLKMKRTIILQKYSSIVDKMYSKNIM